MSVFAARRDNPFAPNLINVYCDEEWWGHGEVTRSGVCNVPVRAKDGQDKVMTCRDLLDATRSLNRYQGLTKTHAREYLGV
jgi:hypothetical protein